MAIDTNNIHVEEFIKENKVDGVATSITIKLVAYDLDTIVEYVGDGNYLNHNDNTWQYKTQVGRIYWDFDISPSLASISMNYTLPVDKRFFHRILLKCITYFHLKVLVYSHVQIYILLG